VADKRDRALVRNAADPRQVRFAAQVEQRREERFANAINDVLSTPAGRIVFAMLIRRAGVYKSIWHPSSEIHYNAGRQDYGHELMADLIRTNEESYQLMEREEWAWLKQQQQSTDAAHTRRAAEREGSDD